MLKSIDFFSKKKILFFTGPSCPAAYILRKIPNAVVRPPARRGDILKAVREKFDVICVIDGTMIQNPTVGAHEIFFALDSGVHLYGSSSLGALRAVEFREIGFQGIGTIYQWYLKKVTFRDDELIVPMDQDNYTSLADPMINLRYILLQAVKNKIIKPTLAEYYLHIYGEISYEERTFYHYFKKLKSIKNSRIQKELPHLISFIKRHSKNCNIKLIDAKMLIDQIERTYFCG